MKRLLLLLCVMAQIVRADEATRESLWQQDLDYFETNLPQKHVAFYKLMPKQKFEKEMADIKRSVPQLSDAEITLRLMRLTASMGVAHTRISLSGARSIAFHRYLLLLQWYSDGLGVVSAAPEYQSALGARVIRIGTMTPDQLETGLAPYISYENKSWLHEESPLYMTIAELLQHLKVADTDGAIELTLVKANDKPFTLRISPVDLNESVTNQISTMDFLHIPCPLYLQNPNAPYWYRYLHGTQTLYIQYRVCENDPKNPFENFAANLFALADSNSVQRMVVDVRLNGGGSSEVINPLMEGIRARPSLNAKGHLFVLIGPGTMSSAEMAAEEFHNSFQRFPGPRFNAILVGEPTGGKPNCYGDVLVFKLPNSNLQVRYSTKHFHLTNDGDPRSREPDITATCSWEDYLAGRDPVMEAVLRQPLK